MSITSYKTGTISPSSLLAGNTAFGPKATGGTITFDGTNWIHTFTSSGTFTPTATMNVEYLVVAGGGGGGGTTGGYSIAASGGGAGGYRTASGFSVTSGTGYTVTVGAGGTGGTSNDGANGNN